MQAHGTGSCPVPDLAKEPDQRQSYKGWCSSYGFANVPSFEVYQKLKIEETMEQQAQIEDMEIHALVGHN